jgi:hypothetical protein
MVQVSNADRIVFPEVGRTKGDVVTRRSAFRAKPRKRCPEQMKPVGHCGVESRIASFHKPDDLKDVRVDDIEHIVKKWKAAYDPAARCTS